MSSWGRGGREREGGRGGVGEGREGERCILAQLLYIYGCKDREGKREWVTYCKS